VKTVFGAGDNSDFWDREPRRDNLCTSAEEEKDMPLYIDVHKKIDGMTAEKLQAAHAKDVEVQHKYGVTYVKYWYDESTGRLFCFVEAPSKEAAEAVHREAHGIVADEIFEVKEGS
jgi:hypothetical protein